VRFLVGRYSLPRRISLWLAACAVVAAGLVAMIVSLRSAAVRFAFSRG
jgi:hypothetical protein